MTAGFTVMLSRPLTHTPTVGYTSNAMIKPTSWHFNRLFAHRKHDLLVVKGNDPC